MIIIVFICIHSCHCTVEILDVICFDPISKTVTYNYNNYFCPHIKEMVTIDFV